MHDNNILKIQNETVKILSETMKLLDKANNLTEYEDVLKNEATKLENLEFVIAVVGTLKAGKSTVINAIVGKEILPHRTKAMTVLPTLITHVSGVKNPILTLPNLEPLNALLADIRKHKQNSTEINFLKTKEGENFIDKISNQDFSFVEKYEGENEIFGFLTVLNDLMRASKEYGVEIEWSELDDIDELPRIEVEFEYLAKQDSISNARLSLLDTPGPNEFNHSEHLQKIFETQLTKASSVMLVINYLQISDQSSGEIGKQFQEISSFIGKEHMFVLANKVDDVPRAEANPDTIKKDIAEYLLENAISKNNVYPISARNAFYSQLGLRELTKNQKIDKNLDWVKDFGLIFLGKYWEKNIENVDIIKECCADAWSDSLFEEPLKHIITHAYSQSSIKSISAALNKLYEINKELLNVFKVHESSLSKDIEELRKDIESIQSDIDQIKEIAEQLQSNISSELDEIRKEMQILTQEQLSSASEAIQSIFDKKTEEPSDETKLPDEPKNNSFFDLFFEKKDKSTQEQIKRLKEDGKLEFSSSADAKKFTQEVSTIIEDAVSEVLHNSETKLREKTAEYTQKANVLISEKLGNLLSEIEKRLGSEISLEIPQIVFEQGDFKASNHLSKLIDKKKESKSRLVEKDYIGAGLMRGLGLVLNNDWGYEEKAYEETNYSIKKEKIDNTIKEIFGKIVHIIQQNADATYANGIKNTITEMLDKLVSEIENYREEMLTIAKKYEADVIDKDIEIASAKQSQEIASRLQNRITVVQKFLEDKTDE